MNCRTNHCTHCTTDQKSNKDQIGYLLKLLGFEENTDARSAGFHKVREMIVLLDRSFAANQRILVCTQ
jgi:hypothetical protein